MANTATDAAEKIDRVVTDVRRLLTGRLTAIGNWHDYVGRDIGRALANRLESTTANPGPPKSEPGVIRASEYGGPCFRKLWYVRYQPEASEVMEPSARMKFLFGDVIEALVLGLVKQAGHIVAFEGARVSLPISEEWRLVGHVDAVINGVLVDIKSMSSASFAKYTGTNFDEADSWGYRWQLGAYAAALGTRHAYLLCVDKQLGHIAAVPVPLPDEAHLRQRLMSLAAALSRPAPPERQISDVPFGKSGNRALSVTCSYCPFKRTCWPDVRGPYLYASGPVWFTNVVREPDVPIGIPNPTYSEAGT